MLSFRLSPTLVFLVLFAAAGCGTGQQPSKPAVDEAALGAHIDSLTQAFANAFTARDTNALAAFYSDDARVLPPNMAAVQGKDEIRKFWAGHVSMPSVQLKLTSTSKIVSEAGDMVVDIGTYELSAQDAKGKPMHDVGKYVTVSRKVNGEWKLVVDTFNSDSPAGAV